MKYKKIIRKLNQCNLTPTQAAKLRRLLVKLEVKRICRANAINLKLRVGPHQKAKCLSPLTRGAIENTARHLFKKEETMGKDKMVEVLQMVADDMKDDAARFDGQPFNGKTVATYFGSQGAAIAAIAIITKEVILTLRDLISSGKEEI